jgi:hypothetical protein
MRDKFKEYEVTFRTWNVKTATVLAQDPDEAIDLAVADTYFEDGEDYEVMDIIQRSLPKDEE